VDLANLPTKHAKNQKFQGLGNVRNREDTAKYLYDLNLNGPQYDPKSRTMKG
jgi:pre-mRNA-processing factor SLU7